MSFLFYLQLRLQNWFKETKKINKSNFGENSFLFLRDMD